MSSTKKRSHRDSTSTDRKIERSSSNTNSSRRPDSRNSTDSSKKVRRSDSIEKNINSASATISSENSTRSSHGYPSTLPDLKSFEPINLDEKQEYCNLEFDEKAWLDQWRASVNLIRECKNRMKDKSISSSERREVRDRMLVAVMRLKNDKVVGGFIFFSFRFVFSLIFSNVQKKNHKQPSSSISFKKIHVNN